VLEFIFFKQGGDEAIEEEGRDVHMRLCLKGHMQLQSFLHSHFSRQADEEGSRRRGLESGFHPLGFLGEGARRDGTQQDAGEGEQAGDVACCGGIDNDFVEAIFSFGCFFLGVEQEFAEEDELLEGGDEMEQLLSPTVFEDRAIERLIFEYHQRIFSEGGLELQVKHPQIGLYEFRLYVGGGASQQRGEAA